MIRTDKGFIICWCFLTLCIIQPYAQPEGVHEIEVVEEMAEFIARKTESVSDPAELYDDLLVLAQNPLNVNAATKEDFEQLYLLTEFQIESLLEYSESYGQIRSIQEIQYIYGFDQELVRYLQPFIYIGPPESRRNPRSGNIFKYSSHELYLRTKRVLEQQKGYQPNSHGMSYLGEPSRFYTRYRMYYKHNFSVGVTAEKDPGETFFRGSNPNGYDFYSGHMYLERQGYLKKVALGDYRLHFGQGMILNSGFSFNKGPYVMTVKKSLQGIRRYSSSNENRFMRGVATTFRAGKFDLSIFYSNKRIDANVSVYDSVSKEVKEVSSLQNSGLHNTTSRIADERSVRENFTGAHLQYRHALFEIGATLSHIRFNANISPERQLYKIHAFTGKKLVNSGIHYQTLPFAGMIFFGETAFAHGSDWGTVNGLLMDWGPRIDVSLLHRYYGPEYVAFYGSSFSESTANTNEEGWYVGVKLDPFKHWNIIGYVDVFSFPWLRYRVSSPGTGHDYFIQAEYVPSEATKMSWRIQQEFKPQDSDVESLNMPYPVKRNKFRWRYQIAYQLSKDLTLKNRLQSVLVRKENKKERGYMIYQDVNYAFSEFPLSLAFRYAMFDTDSYDARIYAYENNVMYTFSVPGYYYKGNRVYLLAVYKWNRSLRVGMRYARSYYPDRSSIGSGLNAIHGNVKSEITLQMRLKL